MPKPSMVAEQIRTNMPEIWKAFNNLAQACHDAGPLDEKTRRLVKLGIAVGAGTEVGTHSAMRHAAEAGGLPRNGTRSPTFDNDHWSSSRGTRAYMDSR